MRPLLETFVLEQFHRGTEGSLSRFTIKVNGVNGRGADLVAQAQLELLAVDAHVVDAAEVVESVGVSGDW